MKAFRVAATYVSSDINACFSSDFLRRDAREGRCTSSGRESGQQKSSVISTHVRMLWCYMQDSCLEQLVVVLCCRCCEGPSQSSFLASLSMEFAVSGEDELQGQ